MATDRTDVIWSPNRDDSRFLVLCKGELNLYQLVKGEGGKYARRRVWPTDSEAISNVTCVSWCPVASETFLAISTYQQSQPQLAKSLIYHVEKARARELNTKRACSYLQWNEEKPQMLAVGFTYSPSGRAIAIYNVPLSGFSVGSAPVKPINEYFHGEASAQGGWLTASQFAVAICRPRGGQLRVVDCDAPSSSVRFHVASARVAHGLCIEPLERNLIAVHGPLEDNTPTRAAEVSSASWTEQETTGSKYVIEVWNVSNPERAFCTVPLDRPVSSMKWSPIRPLLLGVLLQHASDIIVLDFSRVAVNGEDHLTPVTFHCSLMHTLAEADSDNGIEVSWGSACDSPLTSFSWTTVSKNLLIATTDSGSLELFTFHEKVSLGWLASQVPGAFERVQLAFDGDVFPDAALNRTVLVADGEARDIAQRMCIRAALGYGLHDPLTYLRDSKSLGLDLDETLRTAWERIAVLCGWRNRYYSALSDGLDPEILFRVCTSVVCVDDGDEEAQDGLLDAASSFDTWCKHVSRERAAFIAVAQSQFETARQLLSLCRLLRFEELKTLDSLLVASSVGQDSSACDIVATQSLLTAVHGNAYLRSIVEFLTHRDEPERVLMQNDLPVSDRVAFCSLQVTDSTRFSDCMRAFKHYVVERGELDGLLLTGFTTDSLSIVQAFLDRSYDVQSATLFALALFERSELVLNSRPFRTWFEAYRDFLNRTRLWLQRARFDVRFKSALACARPHIHVCCASCGTRISQAQAVQPQPTTSTSGNLLVSPTPTLTPHDATSPLQAAAQTPARSRKASSPVASGAQSQPRGTRSNVCCNASCKKPLPKCAVCFLTLGLPLGELDFQNEAAHDRLLAERAFFDWFCVCVRCRHGGHTAHLQEWFRSHSYCPAADCKCRCNMLDQTL